MVKHWIMSIYKRIVPKTLSLSNDKGLGKNEYDPGQRKLSELG